MNSETELEERLSRPTPEVSDSFRRLPGDLIVLGAAGKMGPTLARMARRAADAAGDRRRVIAVSRFSSGDRDRFETHGVETIACDLLDAAAVEQLPDAPHVIYMAGRKFGSSGDEATTWAVNAYLPAVVCRKFRRSRIVAFSTGNVYGLTPTAGPGSRETDVPQPVGEYAMSCLGRERMFEYFSRTLAIPTMILRLNYACELRYGVLVDVAECVWNDRPIDLSMSQLNVVWQGDANAMTLRALETTTAPPTTLNMTGPERLAVRDVAERFGRLFDKPVRFTGAPSPTALLSDAAHGIARLGRPSVTVEQLIEWIAAWKRSGGGSLGKPTHFESRDGRF